MSDLKLTLRFNAENKQFIGQVNQVDQSIKSLGHNSASTSRSLKTMSQNSDVTHSSLGGLRSQVVGLVSGFSSLALAIQAANRLGSYQELRTRITELVGSNEQWLETEQYIIQVSKDHNKAMLDMADNYARVATLEDAGLITRQQTIAIFEGMSNAQSRLGASSTQLGQSMYGLQQAMSSGIVRAEELNQVVEPLPGLLAKMDKAAGLTSGGFRRLVLDGEVTSEFFAETLIQALNEYEGAAASTAGNINALYADLSTAYTEAVTAFEEPISDSLTPLLESATVSLESMAENAEIVATVFGVTLAVAIGRGTAALTALTAAKVASIRTDFAKTAATRAEAQATLIATTAEIQRLQSIKAAQLGVGATTRIEQQLTAARVQQTAATNTLSATQARATVTGRALGSTLSLMGGPLGVAMMAAGAIGYFALSARDAQGDTKGLADEVDNLLGRFDEVEKRRTEEKIEQVSKKVAELRADYIKAAYAPVSSGQNLWQQLTESHEEYRTRQKQEVSERSERISKLGNELAANEERLLALQNKLEELKSKPVTQTNPNTPDDPSSNADADKAAEKLLENLQRQVALYGNTSEAARIRYELEHGGLQGVNAELRKNLELQAQRLDSLKSEDKDTAKIDAFRAETEALNREYAMRLWMESEKQNEAKIQEQFAYQERQEALSESFQAAYEQAIGDQELMTQLESEYFANRELLRLQHQHNLTRIEAEAIQQRKKTEDIATRQSLQNYQTFMGGIGRVMGQVTSIMQQSGKDSEALFYMSQAIAIANAVINTELAASKALAYVENMTLPQALASQAAIRTVGYASVGLIAGQTIAGMAHDGINRVPAANEGTWLLKKDEMVLNTEQADSFRWMVAMMQQMKTMHAAVATAAYGSAMTGGMPINVNVYGANEEEVNVTAQSRDGQLQIDMIIDRAVSASMDAMYNDADNGGRVSQRILKGT